MKCPIEDDVPKIYEKCSNSDALIFAIPTYGGIFLLYILLLLKDRREFSGNQGKIVKKGNLIIIGNLSAGGDRALHEALYNFANLDFYPETLLLAARGYGRSSINGDLIEVARVRDRPERFAEMIMKEY